MDKRSPALTSQLRIETSHGGIDLHADGPDPLGPFRVARLRAVPGRLVVPPAGQRIRRVLLRDQPLADANLGWDLPGDGPAYSDASSDYWSVMFGSPLPLSPLAVRVHVPPRGVPPL